MRLQLAISQNRSSSRLIWACRAFRCFASAVAVLALASMPSAASAQTFDPAYPVCLQSYGPTGGISCRYASMAECKVAASGRSAQCMANPYYGKRRR